jgi:hypothetical protein
MYLPPAQAQAFQRPTSPVPDKTLRRSRLLNLFFPSGAPKIVRRKSLLASPRI